MAGSSVALRSFTVRRQPAVLVAPASPTPRKLKLLSDIDDQETLRFHVPVIHFFQQGGDHAAKVLRDAIARALVLYYPFAGRLRELEGRKLAVDCIGEGVLFVEAEADVHLENHTMADGAGMVQFLAAVADLAGGAATPTVRPVWGRELLMAPQDDPSPWPSFAHHEYDYVTADTIMPLDDMAHRSLFFGPRELAALRSHLPPSLRHSTTTFELLAGCMWKFRTMALVPEAHGKMRMICIVNLRGPLDLTVANAYLMSDVSKAGIRDLDYGWGKPVYAGPAKGGVSVIPGVASFIIAVKNALSEDGITVTVCLHGPAMDNFMEEMSNFMQPTVLDMSPRIRSAI